MSQLTFTHAHFYCHNYNVQCLKSEEQLYKRHKYNCERNLVQTFICRSFEGWIEGAEKKIVEGYPSPNNMEEATTMVNNCKVKNCNIANRENYANMSMVCRVQILKVKAI